MVLFCEVSLTKTNMAASESTPNSPETGRERNPDSLAAQRERESHAEAQLDDALDPVRQALDVQAALDELKRQAMEGKESVVDLYEAGKEAVSAAVDRKLGDLGRWFDRKTGEVDALATRAGRAITTYGGAFVGGEGSGQSIVDYYAAGYQEAGAVTRETAEHALGITALREELAATRRTLEGQARASGATASTDVAAAGVEAGAVEPERRIVLSENGLNVRSRPGSAQPKVDTLQKGETVSLVPSEASVTDGYVWRKIAGPGSKWVASGPRSAPDKFLA